MVSTLSNSAIKWGLATVAVVTQALALWQTPYANGWDGYYYVMQADYWLSEGRLYSLDYSLIYPYVTAICGVVGDAIVGVKVANLGLMLALALAVYQLAFVRASEAFIAALAAIVVVASPTVTYFVVQFPKNTLGLVFFLIFLRYAAQHRWVWTGLFLFLTLATHRMTGGLALVIAAGLVLQHGSWHWWLPGLLVAVGMSFLPGLLSWQDMIRFRGELSWAAQYAPHLFFRQFAPSLDTIWRLELWGLMLGIPVVIVGYAVQYWRRATQSFWRWVGPLLLFTGLFPFFRFFDGSMGYRFFLLLPVWVAVLCVPTIAWRPRWAWGGIALGVMVALVSWRSYRPHLHDPPQAVYSQVAIQIDATFAGQPYDLIVAHKGLAEHIVFESAFRASNWAPEAKMDPNRVLRVVADLQPFHLDRMVAPNDRKQVHELPFGYYIAPESVWLRTRKRAEQAQDEAGLRQLLSNKNPWILKPKFLRKAKE